MATMHGYKAVLPTVKLTGDAHFRACLTDCQLLQSTVRGLPNRHATGSALGFAKHRSGPSSWHFH